MADVFISYDENSAESIVRQISQTLEQDGISCWYAGRDMEKDALRGVITEAIEECRVFLLVLNENALKSAYVQTEVALVTQGFDDSKVRNLGVFRADNCNFSEDGNISAFWKRCQIRITDGHTSHENAILSLKGMLKTVLREPTKLKIPENHARKKPSVNSRRWDAAAGGAIAGGLLDYSAAAAAGGICAAAVVDGVDISGAIVGAVAGVDISGATVGAVAGVASPAIASAVAAAVPLVPAVPAALLPAVAAGVCGASFIAKSFE